LGKKKKTEEKEERREMGAIYAKSRHAVNDGEKKRGGEN